MKYLATIKYGTDSWSQSFDTEEEAIQWIDENNNNLEHTAIIDEINGGLVVNGYLYNKGIE